MNEPRLTIELVPATSWYSNVRSHVTPSQWEVIKKAVARNAGYVCEICGGQGPSHPVECHEVWEYNDAELIQRLVGLVALCPDCHRVKHIGLAYSRGQGPAAERHLRRVNGWSIEQARAYIEQAFITWRERSRYEWALDLRYLEEFDPRPPIFRKNA